MRKLTLTPQQIATVLHLVRGGAFVSVIEKRIGVGPRRIWDQVQAGETEDASDVLREFAEQFRAAEAEAEIALVERIRREAEEDPKYAQWLLERRWPKRWAGRSEEHREKDEPEKKREAMPREAAR